MTIKKTCALFLLALLAACDIAGQPCGLLNESACSTTPTIETRKAKAAFREKANRRLWPSKWS